MTALNRIMLVVGGLLFAGSSSYAYKYEHKGGDGSSENQQVNQTRAAGCAPAEASRFLEFNNVRAFIEQGGSMWQDRSTGRASYEVPRGEGIHSIYAGALWMGGYSPDQQLKLAAVTFRTSGNDFWPGPLTANTAEIDAETCTAYDEFYPTTRQMAEQHRQYYDCLNDPECDLESQGLAGYVQPSIFDEWPAHGDTDVGQDYYLAPFYDYNEDGFYNPTDGDYPYYDLFSEIDCANRRREDVVPLFGDRNYYWIFNDKGNIHTESQGQPIGMEIRAQAFAFATNDEINNMTFYNYVVINQGTQTLNDTYFCQWVDPDVGGSEDDFVGCDVQRGLGFAYNGDNDDGPSDQQTYSGTPPAVGVDFFEGPYQDEDGVDNPLIENYQVAIEEDGIPYNGIGIGYGDSIVDNERFGMRKFVYYNIGGNPVNGDPSTALHHYNYMTGRWKNNDVMTYGGDGTSGSIRADYMFPGDTDEIGWGTGGNPQDPWSEESEGNPPGDRRFLQSAGPFTLEPGDYNNITVGVVWAKANSGSNTASVDLLKAADDKAQALFDNCFDLISGPDAPDVQIQEMENELVLYISNENPVSNNYRENYVQFDPSISPIDSEGEPLTELERSYTFQGYKVYQVADENVTADELGDNSRARLIYQVDKEDMVGDLVNYTFDPDINAAVPQLMVDANNEGIQHSFRVTTDQFSQGSSGLVNHTAYHFIVMAYGANQYEEFMPDQNTGQDTEYLESRKAAVGGIRVYTGIPHKVSPEAGGTVLNSGYGDGVRLTQIEGTGNGRNVLNIDFAMEERILEENRTETVEYMGNGGPVNVFVADPVRLISADFELRLAPNNADLESDTVFWELDNLTQKQATPDDTSEWRFESTQSIHVLNEELILDWGLSVTWKQYTMEYTPSDALEPLSNDILVPLESSVLVADPNNVWYNGIPDQDGLTPLNWIRSGTLESESTAPPEEAAFDDRSGILRDPDELYENILGGTWGPYALAAASVDGQNFTLNMAPTMPNIAGTQFTDGFRILNNVNVVMTPDKSKWTRCPVLEMQVDEDLMQDVLGDGEGRKMGLRRHPSVDKNGLTVAEGGNASEANLTGDIGMGWFPGYAVDLNTGERLNMAFGEDSWYGSENGRDMLWNPTSRLGSQLGEIYAGGQHWIYVYRNMADYKDNDGKMPEYDQGAYLYENLEEDGGILALRNVWESCTWVGSSLLAEDAELLAPEDGLIPSEVLVRLRVAVPYRKYSPTQLDEEDLTGAENFWNPLYTFNTRNEAPQLQSSATLENEVLDCINVVPNPYYAFSAYENNRLDNRVKIVNLPEECTVSIFTVGGTLVRQYKKADPLTYIEWDLKNHRNIPIASGVYIIHVEVPDVGEAVLKWFGAMRPVDLENF
ncbi:T9SS type A sorting domain-containing protein [Halocola ammonii]